MTLTVRSANPPTGFKFAGIEAPDRLGTAAGKTLEPQRPTDSSLPKR
jgi:hypothetical protein